MYGNKYFQFCFEQEMCPGSCLLYCVEGSIPRSLRLPSSHHKDRRSRFRAFLGVGCAACFGGRIGRSRGVWHCDFALDFLGVCLYSGPGLRVAEACRAEGVPHGHCQDMRGVVRSSLVSRRQELRSRQLDPGLSFPENSALGAPLGG